MKQITKHFDGCKLQKQTLQTIIQLFFSLVEKGIYVNVKEIIGN